MPQRTYHDALYALNHSLQSNAETIAAVKKAGPKAEGSIQNSLRDLRRIGYQPEDLNNLNVLHVTGTKGKGSTCAFCYSLLRKAAPHLKIGTFRYQIRERIQIDGKPISEEDFTRFFFEVWDRLEATKEQAGSDLPMPTYFMMLTLIAYHAFLSLGVNATILEVGIGGRFDTTNIVPKPIVTGITSLGLDHTFMLGNTLPEIAWQKAGIYKAGVPAYTVNQPPEPLEVIKKEAEKVQASEFHVVDTPSEMSEIKLGLAGVHQRQNASLAMHLVHRFLQLQTPTLNLPDSLSPIPAVYAAGLSQARWAGRCQQIADPLEGLQWFLDGAHTIESLTSCAEWYFTPDLALRGTNLKRALIFNCSGGRAGRVFLDTMLQIAAAKLKLANYEVPHPGLLFDRAIFCTNITTPENLEHSIKKAERDEVLALTTQREFSDAWIDLVPEFPKENAHVVLTIQDAVNLVHSEPERQERWTKSRLAREQSQKEEASQSVGQVRRSPATTLTQELASPVSSRIASVVSVGAPPQEKGKSRPSVRLAKSSSLPVRKPAPPPWLASTTTPTPVDPPTNCTSPSRSSPLKFSSQPSPVKQLDLNNFVFQKRAVGRSASYSTSSRSASGPKDKEQETSALESCSDAPKASTKAPSASKVFILGATKECPDTEASFTVEQITSLRSCVVCGHAWTTRKLPKHKWSHITSCARKSQCDLDTLYMKLIAAVVDASDVRSKKSNKAKGKEKEKEVSGPKSLLAHTVQERAPPKKRGRRVEPGPSNLQPVEDTRRVILERGEALLGIAPVLGTEGQPDVVPGTPTEDQLVEEKEDGQEGEQRIPATQGFAPSKIGGRSRLFGSTLATMNTDSRSGLFYADLPCEILPSMTRSLSTFEPSLASNLPNSPVFLMTPRSAPRSPSSDSSVIIISSSNESESSHDEVDNADDRIPSPALSSSSASVVILDSTHSYISRQAPPSPLSPTDSHASFHPSSRRQSFGEDWDSQEGVYKWEDYNPTTSRPPSPTGSLAEYIHEMSLRENDAMLGEIVRGRSRSPRPISKPRSRSRESPRPPKKGSKSPAKRSAGNGKKSKPPRAQSGDRSSSHGRTKSRPTTKKGRLKSKPRSRSRSRSRTPSPKPRRRRARRGSVYAPQDVEYDTGAKFFDTKMLNLILGDKELHLRILRYEPIKFEDILNLAMESGFPKHGLQVKLKAFLDSQCINFYTQEALGRKKKRHP